MIQIAILDDFQNVALQFGKFDSIENASISVFNDHLADEDDLVGRLEPFDVIVAMRERTPFPSSLIARLPKLALLITTGLSNASIDLEAAKEHGVTICGTNGLVAPTAELAFSLILAVTRNLTGEDASVRSGGWQVGIGPALCGKTLGIVGLGRLGSKVASYAKAFDMETIAWSQNLTKEMASAQGVERVDKDELFSRSDIVTIHLKLSARTTHLIGAYELALLGPSGYLVNTSRGPIVDENALIAALRDKTIAGAALDVYDTEPLPRDHLLRTLPNTVITPHIGYVSSDTYAVMYREAREDIEAFLHNDPIRVLNL